MKTEEQKAEVKQMVQGLYRLAQMPVWEGEVNDAVAEVFGIMLFETQKCSKAFKWLPPPPSGRATIVWLAIQFARGAFRAHSARLAYPCARVVIARWGTQLEMASRGLAMLRLPKCT